LVSFFRTQCRTSKPYHVTSSNVIGYFLRLRCVRCVKLETGLHALIGTMHFTRVDN